MIKRLIRYTGVSVEPEAGVWGIYEKKEEQDTLKGIYENTPFIVLLKKYAESANKEVLTSLNPLALGKFLAINGLILRAKRAFKDSHS